MPLGKEKGVDLSENVKASDPLDRNFKFMILNSGIARTATAAFAIAIVWITLQLTGSPIISGFADSMVSLPLFLSFVFGAYIDKMSTKKNLAIISSLVRAAAMFLLFIPLIFNSQIIRIMAIFSVSFIMGMTSDILNSIRSVWMKQFLVETSYKKGSSLFESMTTIAQAAGYGISGALLILGFHSTIYVLALIFTVSTFPLATIKDRRDIPINEEKTIKDSISSGLKYIRNSASLKSIIVITLFLNLAFGSVSIFFAYLVDYTFRLPATFYGFLFLIITAGIIVGSVLGSRVRGKIGFHNAILLSALGLLFISMGFIPLIYIDFVVVFFMGLMIGVVNVITQTGFLKIIDKDMVARVMGAFSTFALGITFLSGGIGGVLIHFITLKWSFALIGAIIAIVAIISISFREYYNISV